jgi:dipeptidyl aminopeptidase/acylaminoacyl peptidase
MTSSSAASKPAVKPTTEDEAAALALVEQLRNGQYADARKTFDATMSAALDVQKLQVTWEALGKQAGPLRSVEGTKSDAQGPYTLVAVTCAFENARIDVKLAFDPSHHVAGLFFLPTPDAWAPPAYAKPDAVDDVEITIGDDPWKLPGTLSLPKGKTGVPAVILVHGSGPGDRDESIGPNRPFSDLAAGLAARGIAVLRYDKRTKVYGPKIDLSTFTAVDESVTDTIAALHLLEARPEIDPKRIWVAGHSLGGFLAPRIAEKAPSVRGIALLAGSTRDLLGMMLEQQDYLSKLDGKVDPSETELLEKTKKAKKRVDDLVKGAKAEPGEVILGAGPAYFIDLAKYDALATVGRLDKPVFVAQGERDYQVTKVDFERWKKALAGKKDVEQKLYPALNHLLAAGEGKSAPEEYERRTPVDATLVDDLATFVLSH